MAVEEIIQNVTMYAGIVCGGFLGWCVGTRRHVRAGVLAAMLPVVFFGILALWARMGWHPPVDQDVLMRGGTVTWRAEPVPVPLPVVYGVAFGVSTAICWVFGRAYLIHSEWPEAIPDRVDYRAVASCRAISWPLSVGLLLLMERKTDAGWVAEQTDKGWLLTATASALVGWLIGWVIAAVQQRHRPDRYRGHALPDGDVLVERRLWIGIMIPSLALLVMACGFRQMLPGWISLALVHIALCTLLVRAGIGYQERVWAGAYAKRNNLAVLYIAGTRGRLRAESGQLFASALEDLWPSADRRFPIPRQG